MMKCNFFQEYKLDSVLENASNLNNHINRLRKKGHIIISIDYQVKILSKLGVEGNSNLIKGIYKNLVQTFKVMVKD